MAAATQFETFLGRSFWDTANGSTYAAGVLALGTSFAAPYATFALRVYGLVAGAASSFASGGIDAAVRKVLVGIGFAKGYALGVTDTKRIYENAELANLVADLNSSSNTDTPDRKAQRAAECLAGIKNRLGEIPKLPSTDPAKITAEENKGLGWMIYTFARSQKMDLKGGRWHEHNLGGFWYNEASHVDWWFVDCTDVRDKLNALNWRP